jgi:hypothetical protein
VTLLGESGAGKSTLINALIGVDLLPHDAIKAVTAAVCEVSREDRKYIVQVELRDRQIAEETLDRLLRCMQQAGDDRVKDGTSESQLEIDAGHRRMIHSITGKSPEECVRIASGNLASLLPDEINEVLIGSRERKFEFAGSAIEAMKARVRDHIAADSPMWPFVERVVVRGPFECVPYGVRIVDIPGLNDPEAARERVAREYLATANCVWLVLNYKRAFTGEVVRYLLDTGLLHDLYVRGRMGTFAVVVTHLDGIDAAAIMQKRGLPEDTADLELLQHARNDVIEEVRKKLDEVWRETVRRSSQAQGPSPTCDDGRQAIQQAPVFVVDSADYMRHCKWIRSFRGPTFRSAEDTGVPGLLRWLKEELLGRERESILNRAITEARALAAQIEHDVGNQIQVKTSLLDLRQNWQGGGGSIRQASKTFLDHRCEEHRQSVMGNASKECDKLRSAGSNAQSAVETRMKQELRTRFDGLHWRTLSAIARRNGVFSSTNGSQWAIPQDIVMDAKDVVVVERKELFTESIPELLNRVSDDANDQVDAHLVMVKKQVEQAMPGWDGPCGELFGEASATCHDFAPAQRAARDSLDRINRDMDGRLLGATTEELAAIFGKMAEQVGAGTRGRMLDLWRNWCDERAGVMGNKIVGCVDMTSNEVTSMVAVHLDKIHEYVRNVAQDEAKRIEEDLMRVTTDEELRAQIDVLREAKERLEGLPNWP